MTEGTVKFFNAQKEFGFIAGDDGKDYYVHISQVEKGIQIAEGDRVSFNALEGDRGPKAENVKKISAGEAPKAEEPAAEESDESESSEEQPAEEKKEESA
jgi:CspA family cold shock protein